MAVNLSPYGGVGAQFLDNSGNVLTGGKIFTYAAGTTTNQATYTTSAGNIPHSNPIILDASGRVPSGGEIWLTDGSSYKFILRDANDVLIATYDNVTGINSNFVAFTNQQEIQTATAGQTVFNLTTVTYQPATNSLTVFVDGVNQYGPGAQYAYLETDNDTVTFVNGLHVGALVKFTTSQLNSSASQSDAFQVSYTPPFTGSVATSVGDKLAQTVSVQDFGAVGDGVTDDTTAFSNAVNSGAGTVYVPLTNAFYSVGNFNVPINVNLVGAGLLRYSGTVSSGNDLSLELDVPSWPLRIMYVAGVGSPSVNSFPAMLEIRNLGVNTIIYTDNTVVGTPFVNLLNNIEANGMKVLPWTPELTPQAHITANINRDVIYGLYLQDEPIFNGISVATQNAQIAAYRAITSKPLTIAQPGDAGWQNIKGLISPNWDMIFINWYYENSNTTYGPTVAASNKASALISFSQLKFAAPNATLVPMVGLFWTAAGIWSSKAANIAFAKDFARLNTNGHSSIFAYNASIPGGFVGDVATDSDMREAVSAIWDNAADGRGKIVWKDYVWVFNQSLGQLVDIYNPTYSSANTLPFATVNVGSAIDARKQTFAISGLAANNLGGNFASNLSSLGNVTVILQYQSTQGIGDTATVALLSSSADFYENTSAPSATTNTYYDSKLLAPLSYYRTNQNISTYEAVGIKFTPTVTLAFPWRMLTNGGFIVSNWETTSY
jgi:hypothetical protein